jgi:hypothetical protein
VCHTSCPFPAVTASGRLRWPVSELTIFVAFDRDQPGARGGRLDGRGVRLPGVLGAIVAVGVRACAGGADASWRAVGDATAGALRVVRDNACPVALVAGSAAARRCGGDRARRCVWLLVATGIA